jgi:hypothetical protein
MKSSLELIGLCALLIAGCKSSSNPVDTANLTPKNAAWTGVTFRTPIKNTSDPNAVLTASFITSMNLAASAPWISTFDTVSQASFSNFDQWTARLGTLTEILLKTTYPDGSFSSTVKYTGVQGGVTYSNAIMYSDSVSKDHNYGIWSSGDLIYGPSKHILIYSIDPQGNINAELHDPGVGILLYMTDSTNGSSSLIQYISTYSPHLQFAALWHSDGSGMWTSYDAGRPAKVTGTGIWAK